MAEGKNQQPTTNQSRPGILSIGWEVVGSRRRLLVFTGHRGISFIWFFVSSLHYPSHKNK